MRVVSLGSGSSGNALLVEAGPRGRTRLLVDAGLGSRTLIARLRSVGVHPSQLQGILVTHEHSDHVMGLPALLKHFVFPVIADPRTYAAIMEGMYRGTWYTDTGRAISAPLDVETEQELAAEEKVDPSMLRELESSATIALPVGSRYVLGDIEVTSFPISHDAVAPCGYLLQAGGCRVCVVTDSGEVTPAMLAAMQHADLLVLEANHDRQKLLRGPYPYSLKQRILGSTGHLSNDQTAEAVLRTWRADSVRWLWLAHLSRTNNSPTLALESMRTSLQLAGANLSHIHISALPPGPGPVWDSTQLWHAPSLWNTSSSLR